MAECRLHGECRLAGGLSPRMCDGKGMITTLSAVGYVYNKCGRFSPMPDKGALLGLADKMDRHASLRKRLGMDVETMVVRAWVSRIREACGEAKA